MKPMPSSHQSAPAPGECSVLGERRVHEPAAVRRDAEEQGAEERQPADRVGPEGVGREARKRQVAGAEHAGQQVDGDRLDHRHGEQEHHHRAVHGEDLVVGLGAEQRAAGQRELRADEQRQHAGEDEEQQRGGDVEHADLRVVHRREDAPAFRRLPGALQRLELAERTRQPARQTPPLRAHCSCPSRLASAAQRRRIEPRVLRHARAGLEMLQVAEPAGEAGLVGGNDAGADEAARRDMGEVGAAGPAFGEAADRMTGDAALRAEQRQAALRFRAARRRGRRRLRPQPGIEHRRRIDDDLDCHLRVLVAAELGALAAMPPRLGDLEPQLLHPPRDHVDLAGERGHPEAVDDVAAVQAEHDAAPGRQVDLVGENDLAAVHRVAVAQLPPPIVADDADDQRRARSPPRRKPCESVRTGRARPARPAARPRRRRGSRRGRRRAVAGRSASCPAARGAKADGPGQQRHRRDEEQRRAADHHPADLGDRQRRASRRRRAPRRMRSSQRAEIGGHVMRLLGRDAQRRHRRAGHERRRIDDPRVSVSGRFGMRPAM